MTKIIIFTIILGLLSSASNAQTKPIPPKPPIAAPIATPQDDASTKRAKTAFNKRDVNKDGYITLEEYLQTRTIRTPIR